VTVDDGLLRTFAFWKRRCGGEGDRAAIAKAIQKGERQMSADRLFRKEENYP